MGILNQLTKDKFSREFRSLRVSLTQACNFQCTYCVPKGLFLKKLAGELSAKQLFFLTSQIVKASKIQKLRLTGGEPLLYSSLAIFLRSTKKLKIEKSITTNGFFLEKYLDLLWECGYKRINISFDSLAQEGFYKLARRKALTKVLQAIEKACICGFALKLNVVPMNGLNSNQIIPLLDFCLKRKIECRYIELMQMGHISGIFKQYFVSMQEILDIISKKYTFSRVTTSLSSTSQRFQIPNKGFFGIIPNNSAPFCQNCDRLRLTSDGKLYGCISNTKNNTLRYLLALSKEDCQKELKNILPQAMKSKKEFFVGAKTFMQEIGG